jgi:hypothetical protein
VVQNLFARTLASKIRIPLGVWISVFLLFVVFCEVENFGWAYKSYKIYKGFIFSEINSELEQARDPNQ